MSDRVLVLRRTYPDVTPEELFEAWTDPALVAEWYGPEGFTNEIDYMDVRVGGEYRLVMQAPDGSKMPLRGTFQLLDRPTKLSFSWQWETAPGDIGSGKTLVTVDIRAKGSATEIVLTHEGFATEEQKSNHEMGWTGALDKLGRFLAANA